MTSTGGSPAIHRFLGWWVVIKRGTYTLVGQIVEANDLCSRVRSDDGQEDTIANTAILDSRFGIQVYPSKRAVEEAAGPR